MNLVMGLGIAIALATAFVAGWKLYRATVLFTRTAFRCATGHRIEDESAWMLYSLGKLYPAVQRYGFMFDKNGEVHAGKLQYEEFREHLSYAKKYVLLNELWFTLTAEQKLKFAYALDDQEKREFFVGLLVSGLQCREDSCAP